jgi:hypothetical protein
MALAKRTDEAGEEDADSIGEEADPKVLTCPRNGRLANSIA